MAETSPPPGQPKEDHRVSFARTRRARMEAKLLSSVMAVYPEGRGGGPAVIEDVIAHAQVSRGTFYKYFASLDEAVSKVGSQMADEMSETTKIVHGAIREPTMRTAAGFQLFLLRVFDDHRWGAFLTHLGLLTADNLMVRIIRADIRLGIETGDYAISSLEVATDLLLGAKVEAIRRIILNQADIPYILEMSGLVLRSFGVSTSRAAKTVQSAYDLLRAESPGKIPWWPDPIDRSA